MPMIIAVLPPLVHGRDERAGPVRTPRLTRMWETPGLRRVRCRGRRRPRLWCMRRQVPIWTAAVALALAGCSHGTPGARPRENPNSVSPDVAAMVACFRAHGMPDWPDPNYDPRDGRWHLDGPPLKPETRQACA